jgi:7-cyano-7-deazaguanine synthase
MMGDNGPPKLTSAMHVSDPRTIILLSGGIDSASMIPFLSADHGPIGGLFIDYGQAAAQQELNAARQLAAHFGIPLITRTLEGAVPKTAGMIRGRNAMLIIFALLEFPSSAGFIAIGIHAGTTYGDCSSYFVDQMQAIVDGYCQGAVRVVAPFLHWSKQDIWMYAKQQRVPVAVTYSCELGLSQPCGKCLSCMDLESLYACT